MDKINSVMKQAGSYQGLRERASQESKRESVNLCLQSFEWETRAHRMVEHTQLENLTAKEKRQAEGIAAIKKLREETGL